MELILKASIRAKTGKCVNRRLRAQGQVPGVLYGAGEPPISLAFLNSDLHKVLKKAEYSPIVHLEWDNQKANAILKDVQYSPVSEELLHVDLLRIAMNKEITLSVPINIVGVAQGAKQGGIVEFITRKVQIKCLPTNIPEKINVDITNLMIGDSLELKDLEVPEGVTINEDLHHPVVVLSAPSVVTMEVKEEVAPGEDVKEEEEEKEDKSPESKPEEKKED